MAKYISGINRSQITLFPDCIDDFISEDSDVRVLDAFVDSLDMAKLGFKNASPLPSKAALLLTILGSFLKFIYILILKKFVLLDALPLSFIVILN